MHRPIDGAGTVTTTAPPKSRSPSDLTSILNLIYAQLSAMSIIVIIGRPAKEIEVYLAYRQSSITKGRSQSGNHLCESVPHVKMPDNG